MTSRWRVTTGFLSTIPSATGSNCWRSKYRHALDATRMRRKTHYGKTRFGKTRVGQAAFVEDHPKIITTEETMNVDRRQLALPVLAIGLLGVMPAFAGADEDAVTKNLEAFRAAQAAANAEILASLCAAELSYSHSSGVVEDKATFVANATKI